MKKKSFVPLLGVAFVVAVISTSIFYGLFAGKLKTTEASSASRVVVAARELARGTVLKVSDVKDAPWSGPAVPAGSFSQPEKVAGLTVLDAIHENEPVTQARVTSKSTGGGGGMGIPAGMRAVSIHAYDSLGVLNLLKPGLKVDVQLIGGPTPNGYDQQLRTILQNVEVLAVQAQADQSPGRLPAPVVTLLANPKDAAVLGLADSSARVRLALRNPLDEEKTVLPSVALGSLFKQPEPPRPVAPVVAAPRERGPAEIQLWVRFAGAGPDALKELAAQFSNPDADPGAQVLQVTPFRGAIEKTVDELEARKLLEVLAASRLSAANHREVGLAAGAQGAGACRIHVQFTPAIQSNGSVRLRVSPEISAPGDRPLASRRMQTEVDISNGQSFLIRGLLEPRDMTTLWERLFPGRPASTAGDRELLVLVTAKFSTATEIAALRVR